MVETVNLYSLNLAYVHSQQAKRWDAFKSKDVRSGHYTVYVDTIYYVEFALKSWPKSQKWI